MNDIRCTNCGKLLFRAELKVGAVEKKCDKCGTVNKVEASGEAKPREGYASRLNYEKKKIEVRETDFDLSLK